jgi:hypothetical protein
MNKYFDKLASTEIQRVNITPSSAHTRPKVDATPKTEPKLIELHNFKHLMEPQNKNIDHQINNNLRVIVDKDDVYDTVQSYEYTSESKKRVITSHEIKDRIDNFKNKENNHESNPALKGTN